MYKNIQKLVIVFALAAGILVAYAPATVSAAHTQAHKAVCDGVAFTGSTCDSTAGPSVAGTIKTVINLLSFFIGVAAVVMIIIGGFKYITSSGDSSSVKSAKDTIVYAIIGLVVVALAQVVVKFVLKKVG